MMDVQLIIDEALEKLDELERLDDIKISDHIAEVSEMVDQLIDSVRGEHVEHGQR